MSRIDLNNAAVEELQEVPGIGPTRARAIVKLREKRGGFSDVRELDQLPGATGSITLETYKLFKV